MPLPGPRTTHVQSGRFACPEMFTGFVQVTPSSSLDIMNTSIVPRPVPRLFCVLPFSPAFHVHGSHTRPFVRSTTGQGLQLVSVPTSVTTVMGPHDFPPSVLRLS